MRRQRPSRRGSARRSGQRSVNGRATLFASFVLCPSGFVLRVGPLPWPALLVGRSRGALRAVWDGQRSVDDRSNLFASVRALGLQPSTPLVRFHGQPSRCHPWHPAASWRRRPWRRMSSSHSNLDRYPHDRRTSGCVPQVHTANRFRRDIPVGPVHNPVRRGGQLRCEEAGAHRHATATSTRAPPRSDCLQVPRAWRTGTTATSLRPR